MTPSLRKKRVWSVADFAMHAYGKANDADCLRARRFLVRLNDKHGGKLFMPRGGTNCAFTFAPATLARLEPDLFEPIESLEVKVDAIEDDLAELRLKFKRVVMEAMVPEVAKRARSADVARQLAALEAEIQKLKARRVPPTL